MKYEKDPVAAAAQALAEAMDQAQRAISAARSEASPAVEAATLALAASQKECQTHLARISDLERASHEYRQKCDRLATERDIARESTSARDRRVRELQLRVSHLEQFRREEREALNKERVAVEEMRLKTDQVQDTIATDRANLRKERAKFEKERTAPRDSRLYAVRELKRTVTALQAELERHEHALNTSDDESPHKRRRANEKSTADTPQEAPKTLEPLRRHPYPRDRVAYITLPS
ncbi:hypothetical protein B0H15DRAFT_943544 [Mycena belliarum]|uniref:Uncharacterized protein n=1 Tax=Mycena belliarum TaxID=1033014 RepID=A0AAD6ULV1_9AGAR|nr:hypothetical protein B0H15DRAFT_943544 [Mycena belliae]